MKRGEWSPEDEFILRKLYPNALMADMQAVLGRDRVSIRNKAIKLGLRKSCRFMESKTCRFKPGTTPPNKGVKRGRGWAPGRMAEGQFKVGRKPQEARNYQPIGTLRVTRDGYLERKVTDDQSVYPARRWRAVHVLVWEAENGPVPTGHVVVFKPARKTTDVERITPDAVECISRAENMRRNSYHTRYPKEVAQLIQLRGALNRKLNRRGTNRAQQAQ